MLKKIMAAALAILAFHATASYAEQVDYIISNQKNFNAFEYTKMVECDSYTDRYYSEGSAGNFVMNEEYFGSTSGGEYIVYKDMNFGKLGAVSVDLYYSVKGNYTGILEFRKDSPTGELLASFSSENNGAWEEPSARTGKIIEPDSCKGVFDLYVVIKTSTFGNLYGFEFKEITSAFAEIDPVLDLKESIGLDIDAMITDETGGLTHNTAYLTGLGDDSTKNVEYDITFGIGCTEKISVCANVETAGRLRIYEDCPNGRLLQEIRLEIGEGEQSFAVSSEIAAFTGNQNICIAFDNNLKMTMQSFSFIQGDIISDGDSSDAVGMVFDTTNYSSKNNITVSDEKFGGYNNGNAWTCWENVYFGEEARLRYIDITYAVGSAYGNSLINIRVDNPKGEIIAQGVARTTGSWSNFETIRVPIIADVRGLHPVYLTVEKGDYTISAKSADIRSFTISGDEDIIAEYSLFGYSDLPESVKARFVYPYSEKQLMFTLGVYDKYGNLIETDSQTLTPENELNVLDLFVDYEVLGDIEFEIDGFVWNAESDEPAGDITVINNDNIELK
ncbi:MAG: carbohydrate-binding protein [Clostridia bacterium]|nr:carbohydrate-binding protein [Clostridia bacterium]